MRETFDLESVRIYTKLHNSDFDIWFLDEIEVPFLNSNVYASAGRHGNHWESFD